MGKEIIETYKVLRVALTTELLPLHSDPMRPFKSYVDACMEGIEAVLRHVQMIGDK